MYDAVVLLLLGVIEVDLPNVNSWTVVIWVSKSDVFIAEFGFEMYQLDWLKRKSCDLCQQGDC